MSVGFIYVFSNPTMTGLFKVGFTCSDVNSRAKDLAAATGVPAGFVVEYFRLTMDVEEIESLAHAQLSDHRFNKDREFFRAPLKKVVEVLDGLVRDPESRYVRNPLTEVAWPCRRCGYIYIRRSDQQLCPKCEF